MTVVLCVDVGSTFTKVGLVDLDAARVVAQAARPTTVGTDVMEGYAAARAEVVAQDPRAAGAEVLACSSAGGGLRVLVLGNEALVTAEAGRRVALGSGGLVVGVVAVSDQPGAREGRVPVDALARVVGDTTREAHPDVVLLTGGTDGGNSEPLLVAAEALVASGWRGPVVVAGDAEAAAEVGARLTGTPYVLAENVVPRIGVLAPVPARAAVREVFLDHVIGGKGLSADPAFARMVRGATPDVVLTGVEVLAREVPDGDVVVVDVGGATTDVHSVVEPDPEAVPPARGLSREVVAPTPVTRTVEGDLGMRWSAVSTAAAAGREDLAEAARTRTETPGWLPSTAAERADERALAGAALGLALRRHAGRARVVAGPGGGVVDRSGVDLRRVRLVVGSGGALRALPREEAAALVAQVVADDGAAGYQLPERARVVVDHDYVLAAVGLLAAAYPEVASRLARTLLSDDGAGRGPE